MGSHGSLAVLILLGLESLAGPQDQEERIRDTDYDSDYAAVVKACEAAERRMRDDPADALRRLEEQVLPNLPRLRETRLIVVYTGINKGAERERHDFFPYRLAGQCALAAGLPEKAVEYLRKSPAGAALLARAEKALEEKRKGAAPPPVLLKPRIDLDPFLSRGDFAGALKTLESSRAQLGDDFAKRVEEVRRLAADHVARETAAFSTALARIDEEDFFKDHLEPCLASCLRVPADAETPELRWARRLGAWFKTRDIEEFDRLALEAAKFDDKFHAVCRRAQEDRLREIERLAEDARQAAKAERPALLARLDAAERAFQALSAAREYKDLRGALAAAKARLPIDAEALDRARAAAASVKDVRIRADELERLWTSGTRDKLGVQDRADLALYLGLYRSMALFLEGKRIEEVASDLRVAEAFGIAGPPPPGVSPKVARVYELVRRPR